MPSSNDLTINAGDQIMENLKENDQLGWVFTSEEKAVDGVRSGKYYAAIVIPEDFSDSLLSVLSGTLETPELNYYINEKINANRSKDHRYRSKYDPDPDQRYFFIHCR